MEIRLQPAWNGVINSNNFEACINFTKSKESAVLDNVDFPPRHSVWRTNNGM